MSLRRWLTGIRFATGFLLWPVILTSSLCLTMDVVLARLGGHPDGPANIGLGCMILQIGTIIPFLAVLFFGLPYVLVMREKRRLGFWGVMIPTLLFSVAQPALVYISLCGMHPAHPLAEAVAMPQVPFVILCGLLFYFVAVWKSGGNRA
jgi:hypothetical protein